MRSADSLARTSLAAARPPIAHVITESNPFGGAQRNTLLTVQGLARDGYPVELVCGPGGALIPRAEESGVPVHVLPDLTRKTEPRRDLKTAIALYRLFRARRYRIVHTHSTKAGLLGRLAASAARVPVVVHTFHGFPFVLDDSARTRVFVSLERCVGRLTDASVCVADALRTEVSRWRIRGGQRLVTIYSGIDFASQSQRRSAVEVKRELGVGSAWPIVGSVGHLREAKAQHDLVEAVGRLRADFPDIRLVIAGEGEQRGFLERRIRDLELCDRVYLLGERDDVPDLLGAFDVYAMSSHWEGVGRALSEAMYWGLPVVVTGVYGVKEIVRHEETGLVVPPRDPQALAAAIGRVLGDPALARRLGSQAKQRVKEQMDGERMIEALESLYAELGAGER
jgi:glycosyltransferase involved in cell wall biosynthesis